jgi:NhaP-type Na+/H+ and K+/H+ antiporter
VRLVFSVKATITSSGALAVASFYLITLLFFGNRGGMRRGQQAPIDEYIPSLSPLVQHTLQLFFLLALLLAVFPQLFSKLASLLRGFLQSASLARRQK